MRTIIMMTMSANRTHTPVIRRIINVTGRSTAEGNVRAWSRDAPEGAHPHGGTTNNPTTLNRTAATKSALIIMPERARNRVRPSATSIA